MCSRVLSVSRECRLTGWIDLCTCRNGLFPQHSRGTGTHAYGSTDVRTPVLARGDESEQCSAQEGDPPCVEELGPGRPHMQREPYINRVPVRSTV